jgi:hypothetical protein
MEVSVQSNVPRHDPWEVAYLRFETPEQEIGKLAKRLSKIGGNRVAARRRDRGVFLRPGERTTYAEQAFYSTHRWRPLGFPIGGIHESGECCCVRRETVTIS